MKIEDVEITAIHREIARRPGEWVMIPILSELVNWKWVEKRAIRYFGGELNVKEKRKKKRENKRRRVFEREKKVKKKEVKIKTISTYKVEGGKKKYEDLWDIIKEGKGKVTVKWSKGEVDTTRWEKYGVRELL
jgi:hypothetical protein